MRKVLVVALALALVGSACQGETKNPGADPSAPKIGDQAPDFSLDSPDAEISLADYRGERPVLLYFSMGPG